jgi:hypothetical protein
VERTHGSLQGRLVFSFKKDNFKRIGNALCSAYPFLFIKETKEISGIRRRSSAGKSVL